MSSESTKIKPKHSTKDDVAKLTKRVYEPLLLAGTGGVGDTWVCTYNPSAPSSSTAPQIPHDNSEQVPLYAVKIPSLRSQDKLHIEIAALKHAASIPSPASKHIQQYVDHDRSSGNEKDAQWLASRAVVGCTLAQLEKVAEAFSAPLPKPLVLTIALQLCDALDALEAMEQQLFHGDLCPGNVMLDTETESDTGAPTVVVIDFGLGKRREKPTDFEVDWSGFYRVLCEVAGWECDARGGQDAAWDEFVAFLEASNTSLEMTPLGVFRERFGEYARRSWEGVSTADLTLAQAMLTEASKVMRKARDMAEEANAR